MKNNTALILGSGPAGVSAAFRLVKSGFDVKLVTADKLVPDHFPDDFSHNLELHGALSPKVASIIGKKGLAAFQKANRVSTEGFAAQGALCHGGLSRAWGVVSPLWRNIDFNDFPFDMGTMAPHYSSIVQRVPYSASLSDEEQRILRLSDVRAIPIDPVLQQLQKLNAGMRFQPASCMVATSDKSVFRACQMCNGCFSGCEFNSLYRADLELRKLETYQNFELLSQRVVRELTPMKKAGYRVHVVDNNGRHSHIDSSLLLVGLGAIATTRLIGGMLPDTQKPTQIQSTPAVAFSLFHAKSAFTREKSGFSLAHLMFDIPLHNNAMDSGFGTLYPATGLSPQQLLAGSKLPALVSYPAVKALHPALYITLAFLPGRYSKNRLSFCQSNNSMSIHGGNQKHTSEQLHHMVTKVRRETAAAGFFYVPGSLSTLPPGGDSHYGASLPMGKALSEDGELNNYKNLFVIDGAALTTLSSRHPTLTIMANADRIASQIVKRVHS